ncbi:CGNR zinc finger domain-containing protein [Thermopolyspora flexuosa]|uniref:CGNR zinc finger protein n=1 Tax=Thermopolyspora flexuosa TaxID=103836 RepID=A0A543ITM3_9ACTN|nr:CGNR zinc finger domain-containing protein [Thermopolyspora flexuosa]TQM73902.1 CGNR zinc finger protein [Thermopolyspora flexuosa]
MDLSSYADLAVKLVNHEDLSNLDGLRTLLGETGRGLQAARITRGDLDAMRELREELTAVFEAVAKGDEEDAVERLNLLLIRHPAHPQIVRHDDKGWHMHLTGAGRVYDQYAVCAVMGLATLVTRLGLDRLGLCQAAPCRRAYLDVSSNRSRRYCSKRCASRANVARFRARRRGGS